MRPETHIVLISTNAGQAMGGEAIKVYQFFLELVKVHPRVTLITHGRCRDQLWHLLEDHDIRLIDDDAIMLFLWRSRILRFLTGLYFHLQVRRLVPAICAPGDGTILHYVCPISPVDLRLPPPSYHAVLGPLNGNLGYPPAFAAREGLKTRMAHWLQAPLQHVLRRLSGEKRRFRKILVSGYQRTRVSLKRAGARDMQMVDMVDSGIQQDLLQAPPLVHQGRNPRFLCSGRFVDYKGIDLAIRAMAQAPGDTVLDVFGDGAMAGPWKALAAELRVTDRVTFCGWCAHDELMQRMRDYRAYLFPTLAEANGIVMQEAMAIGLPVITLRWGGPEGLADDSAAVMVDPVDQDHVVRELAAAVTRLAGDPEAANDLARNARRIAEERFAWERVCADWTRQYSEA